MGTVPKEMFWEVCEMTEAKEIDLSRLETAVKGLRKNIRRYFRSILAWVILSILMAVMIPSWRRPWDTGHLILAFILWVLPLLLVMLLHFAIFFKVIGYCLASKKNFFLTFVCALISLAMPLGAFLIVALLVYDSKKFVSR